MANQIYLPNSPRIAFKSANLNLGRKSTSLTSPFSGKGQTLNQPYALWSFKGSFSTVEGLDAGLLRSFITRLEGKSNYFNLTVPGFSNPLSGYTGISAMVNGASQTGTTLNLNMVTPSTVIFMPGDYFTVNNELKMVTSLALSDGSGQVTVKFTPALRSSPPDRTQLFMGNAVNLLFNSEDFTATPWTKVASTIGTGISDPLGGTSANSIISTGAVNNYVYQTIQTEFPSEKSYTGSVYLKQGTLGGNVALYLRDGAAQQFGAATVTPTGSWVRYSVTGTAPTLAARGVTFIIDPLTVPSGAGLTTLVAFAQVEQSSAMSGYRITGVGEGLPYVPMSLTSDDAPYDLSAPVLHDISIDVLERY